jgi:UDP-N-acetylglucosamine acyltransferase
VSAASIHPTAIVGPGAQLGADVEVGAYAFVGAGVQLGDGCVVHHHATVDGLTTLGPACELFPYACVGLKTQDLKYRGGRPGLRAGARNVFREFVTVHTATEDGDFTVIGSDNHFLAYTHVAHDCVLGSHIVASNNATMAGHVHVGDHVVIGGFGGIHQFCRIGRHAMISACAKVVKDVPPFMLADGTQAEIRGLNRIGLERAGFSSEQLERVKAAYKVLYRAGLNRSQALAELSARADAHSAELAELIAFAQASERGLSPGPSD